MKNGKFLRKHRKASFTPAHCPLDIQPSNCTPNWQAGKPIHLSADPET